MKEMRHQYTLYLSAQHDVAEGRALCILSIPVINYRPCLVQHLDIDTLIQGRTLRDRRSPYFLDYLNELGISYEDAYTQTNKINLKNLMNAKFKALDTKSYRLK